MKLVRKSTSLMLILAMMALSVVMVSGQADPEGKLAEVIDRGTLICGVSGTLPGFSFLDADTGEVSGFDADFCRALAAAIFGEATEDNLEFVPLNAAERFAALQNGDVDVLFRNTTWTFSRDTDVGGDFGPTTFYDGQGLMITVELADAGVASIEDLDGASICTQAGTTTELNITDAMESRSFDFELIPFETSADSMAGFVDGRCDVLTSDKSQLAALRSASENPSLYTILPDTLSKEPLGPMWLRGDSQWGDVITWTVFATMQAEEYGITSENLDDMMSMESPDIARFVGVEGGLGGFIGLSDDFAANVIREVGNYGEIYERNIVPLGITRENSANAQWTEGGLIYAPAWR
jgi:general L-amino acid transport system substrate-binding protein